MAQRQAAQERERKVANMIAEYGLDPEKDLSALAPILPMLDKNRIDALRQVEAMKIGKELEKIGSDSPNPETIRKLASRSLVLWCRGVEKLYFSSYPQNSHCEFLLP